MLASVVFEEIPLLYIAATYLSTVGLDIAGPAAIVSACFSAVEVCIGVVIVVVYCREHREKSAEGVILEELRAHKAVARGGIVVSEKPTHSDT
jgi:hypothetical protein